MFGVQGFWSLGLSRELSSKLLVSPIGKYIPLLEAL